MTSLTRHHTGLTTNNKRKGLVSANHSQALSETFFSVMIKILLLQNIINVKDSYKIYRLVILKQSCNEDSSKILEKRSFKSLL